MNSQLLNDNWLMSGALETGGRSEDIASFLKKKRKDLFMECFWEKPQTCLSNTALT